MAILRTGTNFRARAGWLLLQTGILGWILEEDSRSQYRETVTGLRTGIPGIKFNAESAERLPGILNVTFPDVFGEAMMHLLDLKGICVSTGSACYSGKDEPSHVLLAMGLTEQQAKSSIRISYGRYNTDEEIKIIVSAVCEAYGKIAAAKVAERSH